MVDLHAQKIKDTAGNNLIVLPEGEFDALVKQIEDIEDIEAYLQAKLNDKAEKDISMEELRQKYKLDD
jgi:inorganic pyrophosphatase